MMTNPWNVTISKRALKDLENVPDQYLEAIQEKIHMLKSTPFPDGVKKLSKYKNSSIYRIRVGFLRIIYSVNKKGHVVIILVIGDRKNVYKISL